MWYFVVETGLRKWQIDSKGSFGSGMEYILHGPFSCLLISLLTHWGWDKLPLIRRRHFQMHFLEWISLKISLTFVPRIRINNITTSVQMIILAQATSYYLEQPWLVYWRIYVSLGLNELVVFTDYFCELSDYIDSGIKSNTWCIHLILSCGLRMTFPTSSRR